MAEEKLELDTIKPEEKEGEGEQFSEEEQKAYEKGWRPQDEYEGDEWIEAKEFNARAPLYEGLSKANKRIKKMEAAFKEFAAHNKKIEAASYEKAKEDIKAARIQALENEEFGKAVDLEDKARELESQATATIGDEPKAFTEWKEQNSWYEDDADLAIYADGLGGRLQQKTYESEGDFYKAVTAGVKKAFPHKFKPLPRSGHAPGGGDGGGKKKGNKYSRLNDDQRKVCREFVEMGVITQEKFIADLEEMGELD